MVKNKNSILRKLLLIGFLFIVIIVLILNINQQAIIRNRLIQDIALLRCERGCDVYSNYNTNISVLDELYFYCTEDCKGYVYGKEGTEDYKEW